MNVNEHLCRIEIDVMIRLRNVLNSALFKLAILMSLVFFQANVKVPKCFTNIF